MAAVTLFLKTRMPSRMWMQNWEVNGGCFSAGWRVGGFSPIPPKPYPVALRKLD